MNQLYFAAVAGESPAYCPCFMIVFFLAPEAEPGLLEALQVAYSRACRSMRASWVPAVLVRTRFGERCDMAPMAAIIDWWASQHLPFVAVSAKTGVNVPLAFQLCARTLLHDMAARHFGKYPPINTWQ